MPVGRIVSKTYYVISTQDQKTLQVYQNMHHNIHEQFFFPKAITNLNYELKAHAPNATYH